MKGSLFILEWGTVREPGTFVTRLFFNLLGVYTRIMEILGLISAIANLIGRFFPDQTEVQKAELAIELEKIVGEFQNSQAQMAINAKEAEAHSLFISGGRPFCIWLGGIGLAYHVVLIPMILFIGVNMGYHPILPAFDYNLLQTMLFGLLGLSGMRTYEKIKGVSR